MQQTAALRKRGAEGQVHDKRSPEWGLIGWLFQGLDRRVLVVLIDGDAHFSQACFSLGAFVRHAFEFSGSAAGCDKEYINLHAAALLPN